MMVELQNIRDLKVGDIVRHKIASESMVVVGTYGEYAIAVKQSHITQPLEWLVFKDEQEEGE